MVPATAPKQYIFIYISLVVIAIGAYFAVKIYWPQPVTSRAPVISSCDINQDTFCDLADLQIMYDAVGSCKGKPNYRSDFDTNDDGCITDPEDLDKLISIYYSVLDKSKIPTPVLREYNENCDFDRDLDCDGEDTTRYHEILAERSKVQTIVNGLHQYQIYHEEYPSNLDELVPTFISEVPILPGIKYEPIKGKREYQLCFLSVENGPTSRVCLPD